MSFHNRCVVVINLRVKADRLSKWWLQNYKLKYKCHLQDTTPFKNLFHSQFPPSPSSPCSIAHMAVKQEWLLQCHRLPHTALKKWHMEWGFHIKYVDFTLKKSHQVCGFYIEKVTSSMWISHQVCGFKNGTVLFQPRIWTSACGIATLGTATGGVV